jgi:hypothetical protein
MEEPIFISVRKPNLLGLTQQEKIFTQWEFVYGVSVMVQNSRTWEVSNFIIDHEYLQTGCVALALRYQESKRKGTHHA